VWKGGRDNGLKPWNAKLPQEGSGHRGSEKHSKKFTMGRIGAFKEKDAKNASASYCPQLTKENGEKETGTSLRCKRFGEGRVQGTRTRKVIGARGE